MLEGIISSTSKKNLAFLAFCIVYFRILRLQAVIYAFVHAEREKAEVLALDASAWSSQRGFSTGGGSAGLKAIISENSNHHQHHHLN